MKTKTDYIRNFPSKDLLAGISRRNILKALLAMSVAPSLVAQSRSTAIPIQKLHHFGLRVSDVARSVAFYQGIFGAPIQARQGDTVCLRIGPGPAFLSLSPVRSAEAPGISHIGISVPDYNVERLITQLSENGMDSTDMPQVGDAPLDFALSTWTGGLNTGHPGNVDDLFLADLDGLVFQLCSSSYCGAVACQTAEASPDAGLFQLVDINHFTNYVSHSARTNQFYLDLFGLSVQSYQGPTSPTVGVGDGKQFLMYVGGAQEGTPTQPGRIDHVSLSVTEFDVDSILEKLTSYGLSARENSSTTPPLSHWVSMRMPNRGGAEGGTPELYFSDPDGIHIQLQHADYCGGGGYLGDDCR